MSEETRRYAVFVNDAGQHGLHPVGAPAPGGWRPVGFAGTEDECVRHVDEHWTDTRPLHLRDDGGVRCA